MKDKVVLYHDRCHDGFASAYVAWKNFGDEATYVPVKYGEPIPGGLEGKEIFIIDFSYKKEELLNIEKIAKRLIVLDHHMSSKDDVESIKEYVFDNNHSGVGITWNYFYPNNPIPRLLAYIEDNDIWTNRLPYFKEIGVYLGTIEWTFELMDKTVNDFKDESLFREYVNKGKTYLEYSEHMVRRTIKNADLVFFEGYEVFAINCPSILRNELGHRLAEARGTFSIVWYERDGMFLFSLRGVGNIDLGEMAKKYGGGGHKNAAAFKLSVDSKLPFVILGKK